MGYENIETKENIMNDIIFYIVILIIFCIVTNLLIISVFRRICIRNAIKKNKLLLQRVREKNSEGKYHTYQSLLHNSLINLRNKFKKTPPLKLEVMVDREISRLSKNLILRLFDCLFLTLSSFLILISLLFSLFSGVVVLDEIQNKSKSIEEIREQNKGVEEPRTKSLLNIPQKITSYFHEKVYKESKEYMVKIKGIADSIFKSNSTEESYKNV